MASINGVVGQSNFVSDTSLKALYGDIVPGTPVPLNSLAHNGLILPDTKPGDWPAIRDKIFQRVLRNFGTGPVPLKPLKNKFEEVNT